MKVDIKFESKEIERGDIVFYDGRNCLVAEELHNPNCILINLDTGLIVDRFGSISGIRRLQGVLLLAKSNEVIIKKENEEEAPF